MSLKNPGGGSSGGGGSGTVTSVGLTSTGGSLVVTGSPVTTSGSINADIIQTAATALAGSLTQAANTSADGLILADATPATASNQQFSPRIRLTGQGWKTTSVAASEEVDWIIENQPVQGTTAPTTNLVISEQVAGGGYTARLTIGTAAITVNGGINNPFGGGVQTQWVSTSGTQSPTGNGIYSAGTSILGFSVSNTSQGTWTATALTVLGNVVSDLAGSGFRVAEGSNCKQGTSSLAAGAVTVANSSVTANSRIFLTCQSLGTVATPQALAVTARTPGTSFTITSAGGTDTSVIAWEIFEPAP